MSVSLLALSSPAAALAQSAAAPPSGGCVTLAANGARYCGELVEEVPQQYITLKLATGEIRRFEWNQLAPESSLPPQPAPVLVPPPPPYEVPAASGGVRVTIESNNPRTELHTQIGEHAVPTTTMVGRTMVTSTAIVPVWSPVCRAPCGDVVSRRANYAIRGEGIPPSPSFSLLGMPNAVTLKVKAGSFGGLIGGTLLAAFSGGLFITSGLACVALGEVFARGGLGSSQAAVPVLRGVGYPLLVGGVVGLVGGIVLAVRSRTIVHLESGERVAALRSAERQKLYLSSEGLLF